MRHANLTGFGALLLLMACASTPPLDGFDTAHHACYAYIYGEEGARTNYEKALSFCREGSIEGNPSSMTLLAEMHYYGYGTPVDINTAIRLYEMAAALGHAHAQTIVFMFYNREFAEQSSCEQKQRGLENLEAAAKSGYEKALAQLATVEDSDRAAASCCISP